MICKRLLNIIILYFSKAKTGTGNEDGTAEDASVDKSWTDVDKELGDLDDAHIIENNQEDEDEDSTIGAER